MCPLPPSVDETASAEAGTSTVNKETSSEDSDATPQPNVHKVVRVRNRVAEVLRKANRTAMPYSRLRLATATPLTGTSDAQASASFSSLFANLDHFTENLG